MENFTNALQQTIAAENWYAAITLALTLPDICGSIDNPGKNNSQLRYAAWFEKWVGNKYKIELGETKHVFMTGNDCYALRCAILHQGVDDLAGHKAREKVERFIFHHSKAIIMHCCVQDKKLLVDIPTFCNDIIDGVVAWEVEVAGDSNNLRKSAVSNLLSLHLPDQHFGNVLFASVNNPFK